MYIAPDSVIKLCKNVNLDSRYDNTIYFSSKSEQFNFFNSKVKYTFTEQSYQRHSMGTLRIAQKADNILDCNYLMFQNSSFGNKWWYAFITNVEYINNETAEVAYEIDVMQTWLTDIKYHPCYIERQMSRTDKVGDNLVPENLELGDYTFTDLGIPIHFTGYAYIVAATFDKNFDDAQGGIYGGVYSGLCYNVFISYTLCSKFLQDATEQNKSEGIVSVFMIPLAFISDPEKETLEYYNIHFDKNFTSIDGYIPKNNKLYTYPYNTLYVTNNEGSAANYPWEYFDGDLAAAFQLRGAMSCTPEIALVPFFYKGVEKNYNEQMILGNFPQCAYSVDTFKAWVAQNQGSLLTGLFSTIIGSATGAIAGFASGNIAGGASSVGGGVGSLLTSVGQIYDRSTQPPQAKGGGGSTINMATQIKGFQFYNANIRAEFAKIIDDFFTLYGYAWHKVEVPNINSRPHWNFVQTKNANMTGDIPANDLTKIRDIFDRGVTFWKNGNNIGNYGLNNSINKGVQ